MEWTGIYWRLASDRNDPLAWSALEDHVRRWARTQLRSLPWDVVDDVVANTCSAVVLSFERARVDEHFGGFVWGFYLNERRRARNAARRRLSEVALDGFDVPLASTDDVTTLSGMSSVWEALAALPPRCRAAVSLKYMEGLSTLEIATELGVSRGNARQLVHVGLKLLRKRLGTSRVRSAENRV